MLLPLAVVGVAGLIAAAVGLAGGPDLRRIAAGLRWPVSYVTSAASWARRRGLPLEWVLATIIVESAGNPNARGDGGKSVGLMQVNTNAHPVTVAQMMHPDLNIQWGTQILRNYRDKVVAAYGGREPHNLDEISRLAYKGPSTVLAAIKRGENPLSISWAPESINRWRTAMARVRALTGRALQA